MIPVSPTLLFLVNDTDFFLSHRLNLAIAAKEQGYRCIVASPDSASTATLRAHGVEHVSTVSVRDSHGPIGQLRALSDYWRVIGTSKPDLVHLITAKPVIFGGIVARLRGIPVVAAISGLGFVFTANGVIGRLLKLLVALGYRLALNRERSVVVFQNGCDRSVFEELGIVRRCRVSMLRGSGVDLDRIKPHPEPASPIVALLPARLLRDKGLEEFVQAAAISRREERSIIFRLQGKLDPQNPTGISAAELQRWIESGLIEYRAHDSNPDSMLASAHIVVLPSYREGLPKSLVDAAAAGRPVVTTDVPGCRDAIRPGETGLLVPVRNARALADAIGKLADDPDLRQAFGKNGRRMAEEEFDITTISDQHLAMYRGLIARSAD
ncbi:glycosyltransferase family 4 protein [Leptolyngbya sp. 15MV]|nr:glycosyltransferase family 4 protein [Leptolyngbya sp. 15MV]